MDIYSVIRCTQLTTVNFKRIQAAINELGTFPKAHYKLQCRYKAGEMCLNLLENSWNVSHFLHTQPHSAL